MAGTAVEIKGEELTRLNKRLALFFKRISNPKDGMEVVASTLESQTKRRIKDEKESPEGEPWQDWSERYRKTRHAAQSLLVGEEHLFGDIASEADADKAEAFASLEYALTHQMGDEDRNIPERPYLGVSTENAREIEQVFADWVEDLL
jgi:phage virion morphogenesis protein